MPSSLRVSMVIIWSPKLMPHIMHTNAIILMKDTLPASAGKRAITGTVITLA